MRISTNTIFDAGVSAINRWENQLLRTQQRVASGQRMLSPADDPIAAARALQVGQADAANTQYGINRQAATGALALTEQALGSATDVLQSIRERAVAGGNGTYTDTDRQALATELRGLLDDLLGVANSTDGEGLYLFSGYQSGIRPFVPDAAGVQYSGDEGVRLLQVSASRTLAVSESGAKVFMRIPQGNGLFVVAAASGNTGTGTYSLGAVTDPATLTGHDYRIDFSESLGQVTYDVIDVTSGATVAAAQPYTEGASIAFDGLRVEISGTPANGDQFTVQPSTSQDVFRTVSDLIALLDTPVTGAADQTRLTNGLTTALAGVDQALDHVGVVRAGVGARMGEVDTLQLAGEDLSIQYQQTLSQLQDLDYAKALSDLTMEELGLQAAQESFTRISSLSLFDYI